jgi:hypothetical protein
MVCPTVRIWLGQEQVRRGTFPVSGWHHLDPHRDFKEVATGS